MGRLPCRIAIPAGDIVATLRRLNALEEPLDGHISDHHQAAFVQPLYCSRVLALFSTRCVCVCVCVCLCVSEWVGRRVYVHKYTYTHTHAQTHKRPQKRTHRGMERLNKCRLVMVADMAIQRFLKGVQTACCGDDVACGTGTPAGKTPQYKSACHTSGTGGS